MKEVLIVGAGLAGSETARQLREQGFEGHITLLGEEPHLPYDRPQLSKSILLADGAPVYLEDTVSLANIDVDLRLGDGAVAADISRRVVVSASGAEYSYDSLVIASGARARRLSGALAGAMTLRTIDDAICLRERFATCGSVAILGGSFLGLEIASACRELGLNTTVIAREISPLIRRVGSTVARYCHDLAQAAGVDMAMGQPIIDATIDMTGQARLWLRSGRIIDANCVVAAVGAVPNTEWLLGSGLELDSGGVACDAYLRAAPAVYAVGDVATWLPDASVTRLRGGHRQNAVQQAATVAYNIIHPQTFRPHEEIPYFWSDVFGAQLQFVGRLLADGSQQVVDTHASDTHASDRFAVLFSEGGRFVGASVANAPAVTAVCMRALVDGAPLDSVMERIERRFGSLGVDASR